VPSDAEVIQALIAERDELKRHCVRLQALLSNISYPPGHFYSPVVDVNDPHAIAAVRIRTREPVPAGIQIDPRQMVQRIERWAGHPVPFPFPRHPGPGYRYHFDNPFFGCHDGTALFSVLMEFKPHRVVEVGCGYSSRLLLDTNQRFFDGQMDLTLIDPSLDELNETFEGLRADDACLLSQKVQDVPLEVFERLENNDILFLDSSHVSKTGSDVNHYLFRIIPLLKSGVLIHIHDILYPFEYLEEWVLKEKRSWNEAYLVHAFLQFNPSFEIVYWANFAWHYLQDTLARLMPLCLENEGGSLWLRRRE
jgi:hypothetical protein